MKKSNLVKLLREYWRYFEDEIEEQFYKNIDSLERCVKLETGIDVEFFFVDGNCVGIGSPDRKMGLIQRDEFNKQE